MAAKLTILARATALALCLSTLNAAPLSVLGYGVAAAREAPAPVGQVARQRLQIFDYVWSEISEKYYDPAFNGVDWMAARDRARPQVAASRDEVEFYALLRSMVGELRDAHTRVLNARQVQNRQADQSVSTGVILFEVEGVPVVFDVRPESPAAEAGLRPGMRVVSVHDVAVSDALLQARADVGPSSSERASLVLSYLRLVAGAPDDVLRLQLARPDGTLFEVALGRRALSETLRFESRTLRSGVGYIKFDRFREPVAQRLREALRGFRDAPGVILDLRSNTGGDGEEGMRAIAPLLNQPTLVAHLATRTGRPPSALFGLISMPLDLVAGEAGEQLYSGPLIILTNEGTASTSEVIAASLQERGRARIVGSRSCGCALGVLRYRRLSDGGALAISEVGLVSGLGTRIEGNGVSPDVPVALTLADFQNGRDAPLEAALEQLSAANVASP